MNQIKNKCKSCVYWKRGEKKSGTCHYSPPSTAGFPSTKAGDFCGEWKPRQPLTIKGFADITNDRFPPNMRH